MYFAYGWPKILAAVEDDAQTIVHLAYGNGRLAVITSHSVQVWTGNQHRVKLGEVKRTEESVTSEGANARAIWSKDFTSLVVLTTGNALHFYDVLEGEELLEIAQLLDPLVAQQFKRVTLSLRAIARFADSNVSCFAFETDGESLLLGLSDGRLLLMTWRGERLGMLDLVGGAPKSPKDAVANGTHGATDTSPSPQKSPPEPNSIVQLEYSAALQVLAIVVADGRVIVAKTSTSRLHPVEQVHKDTVLASDAACVAIATRTEVLAVGRRDGVVDMYSLADRCAYLRTLSLVDWGCTVEDTGAVSCLQWSPDNCVLAVGWQLRGLSVWSVSGCRLMCTIRQGGSGVSASPLTSASSSTHGEPLEGGVTTAAWGPEGYYLMAAELSLGTAPRLLQFPFAKGSMTSSVARTSAVWEMLQAEDRLMLIQNDASQQLHIQHLVVPQSYISFNWPIVHVASSEDGSDIAVAGRQGLILFNLRSKKWRMFGDVSQERAIRCAGLMWHHRTIVVCSQKAEKFELLLYPRYHLDQSSLLCRQPLPTQPLAMDTHGEFILTVTSPFALTVYQVAVQGELTPLGSPRAVLTAVRELSLQSVKRPPVAVMFVANYGKSDASSQLLNAGDAAPDHCIVLRSDGQLLLLHIAQGTERQLLTGVEHFWVTAGRSQPEASAAERPWWAYGHRGMQLWYPSSPDTSSSDSLFQQDPELEFDREVYPLGVSTAAGVIVGVSQRLCVVPNTDMPCFEPTPKAQPILPCLLRHLLQTEAHEEALVLASANTSRPHFSHSLEWLLFTVLDAATASASARRKAQGLLSPTGPYISSPNPDKNPGYNMLVAAAELISHFPDFVDVVVSVARKTDERHWALLFQAAGKPTTLFEQCISNGQYRTAACYILVIEKLEGPTVGQQSALRLLQAVLGSGLYDLAGELVRFLIRSGREVSTSDKEVDDSADGIISTFFKFGFTSSAPKKRADVLHTTVGRILSDHATRLLTRYDLRQLVQFAKGTQFDLSAFLAAERSRAARLEDFPSALRTVRSKLGPDSPEMRHDAEVLLAHMRAVGCTEWVVVLATLLHRNQLLLELFQGDRQLWRAYAQTIESEFPEESYLGLLRSLEHDLAS
eukprot:jgi/Chlat1/5068/Chrsp33S08959